MTHHAELIDRLRLGADCEKEAWGESGVILGMSSTMETAADAIEALEREVEGLRKDAERYRWLRTLKACANPPVHGSVWAVQYHQPRGTIPEVRSAGFGDGLDRAIDAAIQREGASNAGS